MKLKQIKLAGFKSFVDPTVLDLRSDLVGVVGPNGCGKSNIIDAVSCVLGVRSAKEVRGDSITDVIFNGSNTRKPIGQASVELFFDNSDGGIGGEYASYAEISVRREVSRDGTSTYYLNGTRCRRKDIVDVFLGTGLGAGSYSIIGQGMISRIIESKPEDLRGFLEEAAGISIYKRRRHDTELRMRHTAENLARLEDLREEQIKLLEKLQRQAESAQKYKQMTAEKSLLEAQLLALRWQTYDAELTEYAEQIRTLSVTLEEKLAENTGVCAAFEQARLMHEEKSDKFEEVQSTFYEQNTVIARVEQSLQYHKEKKLQLEQDIQQSEQAIVDITSQKATDNEDLFACAERLAEVNPEYEQACAMLEQAEEMYHDARLNLDTCNAKWETFQQQSQGAQQEAEVQKSKIEQFDKQTRDLQSRIDRLNQEKSSLDINGMQGTVADLTTNLTTLEAQSLELKDSIADIQQKISQQRHNLQAQQDEQSKVRSIIQQLQGREASLLALQQAALGKDDQAKQNWLRNNALENAPLLGQSLVVEPGWDLAVETVLTDYLEAVCVDNSFEALASSINQLTDGNVTLLCRNDSSVQPNHNLTTLAAKVTTNLAIDSLIQNILIAEDLNVALQLRTQLAEQQSIVTKDGIWLGKNWLRVKRERDNKRGILQREQELQKIAADISQYTASAEQIKHCIDDLNDSLQELEVTLLSKQQYDTALVADLRDASNKHSAAQQKLENMHNRRQRIEQEVVEHQQNLSAYGEESTSARTRLEVAIEAMATFALEREAITTERDEAVSQERSTKQRAKELRDSMHSLEVTRESLLAKHQGLQHTIARVDKQLAELNKRYQHLQQSLKDDVGPESKLSAELEELLVQRVTIEDALHQARCELEANSAQMKVQEQQKNELEKTAQKIKDMLNHYYVERQTAEVRKETISEQLTLANIDVQTTIAQLPQDIDESVWQSQIELLHKKVTNLGAINLAASEEFEAETQRQQYLEVQYTDLKEALTTLENAIKKIDRETKEKFQDTFNKINANFNELFPKLFGGGKAYIEMVGDDLLNAGVTVMAMPPGKKNATIHLLSGGEKALTAVALVFSIFQLNPAPFCMLDEVDAPLDEANVVRYSNLIKEMSSKVQFILITHNKTTMEIANQLIGVTMKEPGVSRLVSVDLNEAVEMALA